MGKIMDNESNNTNKGLTLIPKSRAYIEYMILIIMKLPRTEKFNIAKEYGIIIMLLKWM